MAMLCPAVTMVMCVQVRTVSGQQQMQGYAGVGTVGVPPGALGEEVRVDCCLMTNDGRSVVTGSSLGPPQVWDMQVGRSEGEGGVWMCLGGWVFC